MDAVMHVIDRYDKAVELLPYHLRGPARVIDEMDKAAAEEFRLRIGHAPTIVLPEGERPFAPALVTSKDLQAVLDVASNASAHTVADSVKHGYITAAGGYRIGFGGQAMVKHGEVAGFLHLSSVVVRITKAIEGIADALLPQIKERGVIHSTLILAPPGGGKTTVLRDLIRLISDSGRRVSVADERGELAPMKHGMLQFHLGSRTDVITGCAKDKAVMMLVRALNPDVLAMDEITEAADAKALENAANCGVTLLATAHASGVEDLIRKPMYRRMIRKGLFTRVIEISQSGSGRTYSVKEAGEMLC